MKTGQMVLVYFERFTKANLPTKELVILVGITLHV
jgi:hypothetical protein